LPTTPALRREQIELQVALITPLIHVKGYAAPETKAAAERARLLIEQAEAVGEPPEDPLLLLSVLYCFWAANQVAFNGDAMRELATQFLVLAEKLGTKATLMIAHRLLGVSLALTGDIAEGRRQLDQAIALYDPAAHRPFVTRFGQHDGVALLSWRARTLWTLGYPDAALTDANHALMEAREIGQAPTLIFALLHALFTRMVCGNYTDATADADELVALAQEKTALSWKPLGMMNQGCLLVLKGRAFDAIQVMNSGIAAWRSTASTVWLPWHLTYLGIAYAQLRRFDDAWRCIGEAVTAIETTKEIWSEAEVHRIAGEIALKSPAPDPEKAEAYFERALAVARQQQTKSWELRAATCRGSGASRANGMRHVSFSLWYTAGLQKGLIRAILRRLRRCSTC
jgi:tetratricopeptide (TPR) repeat protein